jgi:transposase
LISFIRFGGNDLALSIDLRQRIVAAYKLDKHSVRKIAEIFGVSEATVYFLVCLERSTGILTPQKSGKIARSFWDNQNFHEIVRSMVNEDNQATLAEYCTRLKELSGETLSVPEMCNLLKQLKLYRKKKTVHAVERDTPRVVQLRKDWKIDMENVDHHRLIFVDETGSNRGMARRYARAEGEERAHGVAPCNPGENVSIIGSLAADGGTTAMSISGSADADVFCTYVDVVLAPTLRPGDIVVMDNCTIHKDDRVRAFIEACGAELRFLPPYSPDMNPIEECWSKVKTILRTLAARTTDALDNAITSALAAITPNDTHGWFDDCGYSLASC